MSRIFVLGDETGDMGFHRNRGASKYYGVGTITLRGDEAVAALGNDLLDLRRALAWTGHDITDAFHATEDKQVVRDAVFQVLQKHDFTVDVTLLEKSKAQPQVRIDEPTFYKYAWFYHFRQLAQREIQPNDELMVVAASVGTKRMRGAFRSAVDDVVRQCCPPIKRQVAFWSMSSDPALWAADYCLWAVARAWEKGDMRSLSLITGRVRSQYDLFRPGNTHFY